MIKVPIFRVTNIKTMDKVGVLGEEGSKQMCRTALLNVQLDECFTTSVRFIPGCGDYNPVGAKTTMKRVEKDMERRYGFDSTMPVDFWNESDDRMDDIGVCRSLQYPSDT